MNKRKDPWTPKEEEILKELVHSFKRRGLMQKEAFEEAGKKLNRSPGACKHRWMSILKKKSMPTSTDSSTVSLEECIEFLIQCHEGEKLQTANQKLKEERQKLFEKHGELNKEYEKSLHRYILQQKEYQVLLSAFEDAASQMPKSSLH
ncbi:Myb-like DNA-binding domain-containing protein [Falsibacillus albus]|uniref:Myb-like DNA-binding domain-containing protein n=1 Tax=Falsibacillus albus TaxID=2478915 RepID=UPI001313E39F|nr:Myb-like DNA-binding domain-containing protein [Falsibacillus albus]